MSILKIRHVWNEPDAAPSTIHVEFDRELTELETNELAQALVGVHNGHEAARDFANDPHHARHVAVKTAKSWTSETPDIYDEPVLDAQGKPVFDEKSGAWKTKRVKVIGADGKQTTTRTFTGVCGDCGREYVVGAKAPYHYVCPSLPGENEPYIKFRETACHEGCAVDCGRDASGNPVKGA